jgi:signal transduction histidine kinase
MSDAALLSDMIDAAWEKRLVDIIHRDIAATRRLIVEEAREPRQKEDENEELERLASIEREIDAIIMEYDRLQAAWAATPSRERRRLIANLLNTRIDLTFNKLISAAIAEERREVAEADAQLAAVSKAIKQSAIAIFILAAPLVFVVLLYVNRTLLQSLTALTRGADAYAKGDLDYQIPALASREFEAIRTRLVRMAGELRDNRETLRSANEGLEDEVEKRTAEVADAYRLLEEADEARRSFFADVSHELRTPLTVIRGEAEIALRGGERRAADYRESLGRIVEQASQMGRLVEDLLFIARAEAGEPRIEMRSVAVHGLLAEAAKSFETLAADRRIQLRLESADSGAVVAGDRGRLAQVLGVLIDNAIRYSREDGEVRLSTSVGDGNVVIAVEDDGIGIAPADADRVFDRFFRAENAREHSAGVGLGLPVARAIIEAHNGHIRLSPSSSGGVTALITLPVETKLRAIS